MLKNKKATNGGGDDLADDDIYLDIKTLDADDDDVSIGTKNNIVYLEEDDNSVDEKLSSKRKSISDVNDRNVKKKKKRNGKKKESMREIATKDKTIQADYLWECYRNAMAAKKNVDDVSLGSKFTPSKIAKFEGIGVDNVANRMNDMNIPSYFKTVISMKKLKRWKSEDNSPMIVIICISARRCVSILKGLAPMKIMCGKLFAKHMDLAQQVKMLKESTYGIVVGTPNRLLTLTNEGALKLSDTELVIFDGAEINGVQNVCTLNDTRQDVASLIQHYVQKEIKRRSSIRLGIY